MDILSRNNLQDFCRTCLRNLRSGFTTIPLQAPPTLFGCNLNDLPQLLKLVLMQTSLEGIGEHVTFPRRVCQLCHDKLIDIQNFQKLAIQSTNFLSNFLAKELNTLSAESQPKQRDDETDDVNKLLLPEPVSSPLERAIKVETFHNDEVEEQQQEIKNETESIIAQSAESQDDEGDDADDADDEEHSLRSGAANNSSSTPTPVRKRDRNKKSLKCPRCEKHVYKKVYLDAHIRAVHEGYDKPFLCDACEKAFTRYNQLREHISSIHELKKKIMCTFQGCNTSFQSANSLQDHFKVMHAIEGVYLLLNSSSI